MYKKIVVYPYNGITLSIKRNELLVYAAIWMKLKTIMLSERNMTIKKKRKEKERKEMKRKRIVGLRADYMQPMIELLVGEKKLSRMKHGET